jgi:hypothetical protein
VKGIAKQVCYLCGNVLCVFEVPVQSVPITTNVVSSNPADGEVYSIQPSVITHTSLSRIRRGFVPGFVDYKKGCTRLAAASDKVYQLLAHGRWFSLGTPDYC